MMYKAPTRKTHPILFKHIAKVFGARKAISLMKEIVLIRAGGYVGNAHIQGSFIYKDQKRSMKFWDLANCRALGRSSHATWAR